MITESINQKTQSIDLENGAEIARLMNEEDKKVAFAVEKELPKIGQAIDKIAQLLAKGGRMAYFGAGTSGRIGILDASEIPPTFGADSTQIQAYIAGGENAIRNAVENAEDSAEMALKDILAFAPTINDVVVAISSSGAPQYVLTVLQLAQQKGALTIALSSNPEAKMKEYAQIFINPIVGAEVITGSSRLKSGTAQKMILNMLSTGVMIKLGKTYQNYMIDVQMTNQKLHQRALKFVQDITGADEKSALETLQKSQNVKTACVMIIKNCSLSEAKAILAEKGGFLRKVIEA